MTSTLTFSRRVDSNIQWGKFVLCGLRKKKKKKRIATERGINQFYWTLQSIALVPSTGQPPPMFLLSPWRRGSLNILISFNKDAPPLYSSVGRAQRWNPRIGEVGALNLKLSWWWHTNYRCFFDLIFITLLFKWFVAFQIISTGYH